MDFRVSEASAEEVGAEANQNLICCMCHECGFPMWTAVRDNVPTQVKCLRSFCAAITELTLHVSGMEQPSLGCKEK